jgi:hypothetical protein
MNVVTRLQPCAVCRHDPGFGTLHTGCARCERTHEERDQQPKLVVVSREPLVYGERDTGSPPAPPVFA